MEEMTPCAVNDQEVFQRVWQRVMAGRDETQTPIEVMPPNMEGDLSCDCLRALAQNQGEGVPAQCQRQESGTDSPDQPGGWQPAEGTPTPGCPGEEPPAQEPPAEPEPVPEEPSEEPVEEPVPECPGMETPAEPDGLPEEDGPHRGSDLPQLWEEPQETSDRTARLRGQVMESLDGWQFYRHLARRARGSEARVLNSLAGELHRQARKLSAAYFLLTGLRYWPSGTLATPAIQSYWGALRQRHQAEQRQENAFRIAADDWDDPDMQELYAELIENCQRRCRQLRTLLEQDET